MCTSASETMKINVEQPTTNEYFSVKWFSDWEGYGCVASRDIYKNTLVHAEEPFITGPQIDQAIDCHNNGTHGSLMDDKEYLKKQCGKSDEEIESFWQLHDQYTDRYTDNTQKRLWGIISSNSFSNHEKNYAKRLYLTTSRFNHSCSPNLGYDFDDWNIRLYTLRDIKAGEVLCISYSDVIYFFPRETRRYYLLGEHGFDCACTSCNAIGSTVSDKNRRTLKRIAIDLKHRVGSTLYSAEFCIQVNETVHRLAGNKSDSSGVPSAEEKVLRRNELLERVRLRKLSAAIPVGQCDIDLIVEYIRISVRERVDFDMLPIYRLAYGICLKVSTALSPPKEYWAERYLELVRCAKGPDHHAARSFFKESSITPCN